MGEANVTCVAGCTCQPSLVQGHHEDRNSQTHLVKFHVPQAKECEIQLIGGWMGVLHMDEREKRERERERERP